MAHNGGRTETEHCPAACVAVAGVARQLFLGDAARLCGSASAHALTPAAALFGIGVVRSDKVNGQQLGPGAGRCSCAFFLINFKLLIGARC